MTPTSSQGAPRNRGPGVEISTKDPVVQFRGEAWPGVQGFVVCGLGFRVYGLGFRVWGLGFGVWSLGFGVWGLGLGV